MITPKSSRNIIVLICIAFAMVIVFQASWLRNSYLITKDKITITIKTSLDEAIIEQKREVADSVRTIIRSLLRSPADYEYSLFGTNKLYAGFRLIGKNMSYITFPIDTKDTLSAANDPFAFLHKKINEAGPDLLRPMYLALISSAGYADSSAERAQSHRIYRLLDYAEDTATLKRILVSILAKKDFIFDGSVQHFSNADNVYRKPVKVVAVRSMRNSGVVAEVAGGHGRASVAAKLDSLSAFASRESDGNNLVIAKAILDDINSVMIDQVPAIVIKTKLPFATVIANMLVSIIGSLLVMFFIGFCVVYLFVQLMKQKKLADIKNDFISNISHELKTPIATALAAVQGMQYFDVLQDASKTKQYLGTAENEMKRLDQMISQIMHVSVYENGSFQLSFERFNFKSVLEQIAGAQNNRTDKKVHVDLSYTGEEWIEGDEFQITSVFNNLVDNAIKYAGVDPVIHIICGQQENLINVQFSDNGPGIPQTYAERIFEKFFRIPGAHQSQVKGYGLGLHYVKNLIGQHKGSIELMQENKPGCTFIITLPIAHE
jgi:signal transduction histidine kinase